MNLHWSGRWESNPTPSVRKLLNVLTRFLQFGRSWAQNFANFVHCITLRVANDVRVRLQRDPCIRVSHLLFRDSRICSYVHQQTRVTMPKCVHASAFDLELVEDRPEAVLDNFVRCVRSPVAIEEEKPLWIRLPRCQIFLQHRDERLGHRYRCSTRLTLHCLHSPVPR